MQDFEGVIKNVVSFSPPDGVDRVNILLMGGVGSGKSSFISSIHSVLEERISRQAFSGFQFNSVVFMHCSFHRLCLDHRDTLIRHETQPAR